MATNGVCTSLYVDSSNGIARNLYMDDTLFPSIDRLKPNRPSQIFVWDNTCSALDAEWQCYPYALDKCEYLRPPDTQPGFGEDYIQCLEDRFQACRKGAGCDYRNALTPQACKTALGHGGQRPLMEAIGELCDSPEKEYASRESYQACRDKVTQWWYDGCGNIQPRTMSGPITNYPM